MLTIEETKKIYEDKSIETIDIFDTSEKTSLEFMLFDFEYVKNINIVNLNTSKVTNMRHAFSRCKSLEHINLARLNTSNVINLACIFRNCYHLKELDVNSFDTSKATDMSRMFDNCSLLASLDLSNFNTSNVTNMRLMFAQCYELHSLDISSFDFSNVDNSFDFAFNHCSSLTDLQFGTNCKQTLYMYESPLTHESALSAINGLATITTSQSITFKASTYSTLTAAEIKTATDKGWTITSA